MGRRPALQLVQQRRMTLDPPDGGKSLIDDLRAQPGDGRAQLLLCPAGEDQDPNALDAQRREHLPDVRRQSGPVRHDHHARGRKLVRIGEGQIGQAMKADGRLAAARPALNDHDAGIARGDEIELARIDQRRDLWQVPIQRLNTGGRGAKDTPCAPFPGRAGAGLLAAGQLVGRHLVTVPKSAGRLLRIRAPGAASRSPAGWRCAPGRRLRWSASAGPGSRPRGRDRRTAPHSRYPRRSGRRAGLWARVASRRC